MKVVCIDDKLRLTGVHTNEYITEGKIYEVRRLGTIFGDGVFYIMGNNGREISIRKDRFRPLDEIRLEKIEEILK